MATSGGSQRSAVARRTGTLLVLLQLGLAAAIILTTPWNHLGLPSAVLIAVGIVIAAWAILCVGLRELSMRPELAPGARLVRSGPYRWIRHPMYLGLLAVTAGCVLSDGLWWRIALWVILGVVLDVKARIEERYLRERFAEYQDYQNRTWRFIPYVY